MFRFRFNSTLAIARFFATFVYALAKQFFIKPIVYFKSNNYNVVTEQCIVFVFTITVFYCYHGLLGRLNPTIRRRLEKKYLICNTYFFILFKSKYIRFELKNIYKIIRKFPLYIGNIRLLVSDKLFSKSDQKLPPK